VENGSYAGFTSREPRQPALRGKGNAEPETQQLLCWGLTAKRSLYPFWGSFQVIR